MSTPDVDTQLATLRQRIGEPVDPAQGRWTATQLLAQLNSSRNVLAELSRCYPVKDSMDFTTGGSVVAPVSQALPAIGNNFLISTVNDFIYLDSLTWNGHPLRGVRAQDWPDVIGYQDTINGDPIVFMFFGRQIQIFRVPVEAGTLEYRGWAYPPVLVSGGIDAGFLSRPADVAGWHAAMVLKGSDERSMIFEQKMWEQGLTEMKIQYRARGPRFVRTGDLSIRTRPIL